MNAEELMLTVATALDRAHVSCMLVGAFSASFHGISRSTEDADFLLRLEELPIAELAAALGPDFKLDPQARLESFTFGTYYTISHRDSDFSVDLFLLKDDPHDQASFTRRIPVSYSTGTVFLSTAEDVVITKLRWSQGGRREKDVTDARNVLAVQQGKLDLQYVRRWCEQHGTLDLLEKTLQSVPPLPP